MCWIVAFSSLNQLLRFGPHCFIPNFQQNDSHHLEQWSLEHSMAQLVTPLSSPQCLACFWSQPQSKFSPHYCALLSCLGSWMDGAQRWQSSGVRRIPTSHDLSPYVSQRRRYGIFRVDDYRLAVARKIVFDCPECEGMEVHVPQACCCWVLVYVDAFLRGGATKELHALSCKPLVSTCINKCPIKISQLCCVKLCMWLYCG